MTNRDYLMGLSNEKLAEFILRKRNEICYSMQACCCDNCLECFTKWLEIKRKTKAEKGQIRQYSLVKSGTYALILMVTDTECLLIGEDGVTFKRLKSVIEESWTIRKDISIDEFVGKIFKNL